MAIVSVITAVHSREYHHLREAYESLRRQKMPPGWEWEWCVQEDGDTGDPFSVLPEDPRILKGTSLSGRAAVARTMALSRARGVLVRTFDADDVLLPGALMRDIEVLNRVAWCTSACLDLLPDGSTAPGPYDPPAGRFPDGHLLARQEEGRFPVQANTFAARTDLIWALGGWSALTGGETIALVLAAEAVSQGEFIAEPSLLYRKHHRQTTADDRYWEDEEHKARMEVIVKRAWAIRKLGWKYPASTLDPCEVGIFGDSAE